MKFKILMVLLVCVVSLYANTNIISMKDIRQANKGLAYLKGQEKNNIQKVKLKKYYLAQLIEKPSFFSSYDDIFNLYLTAFLQNGRPLWLENNHFVFHTSSNKKYLKRLQKMYAKKYKINLTLEDNPKFWKTEFNLRKIENKDFTKYIDKKASTYLAKKEEKKQKLYKGKRAKKATKTLARTKETEKKNTSVHLAQITRKKEAALVEKANQYYVEHKEDSSTKLGRYILYKNVKKPSIFSSDKPIYNMYLTGVINGGMPKWLKDTRFVFHTASGIKYLKRLQKYYKKKYNLELLLSKVENYKSQEFALMPVDTKNLIEYMQANVPEKYRVKKVNADSLSKEKKIREIERKKSQIKQRKRALERKKQFEEKRRLEEKKRALVNEKLEKEKRKKLEYDRKKTLEKKRAKVIEKERLRKIEEIKIEKEKEKKTQLEIDKDNFSIEKEEAIKVAEDKKREEIEEKQKALAKERKRIAEEKRRLAEEKKIFEENRIAEAKAKEKEQAKRVAKRKMQEKKEKEEAIKITEEIKKKETEAKRKALAKEREKIAEEKRRLVEERKAFEEKKKALAEEKAAIDAQKRRVEEKKVQEELQKKKEAEQRKAERAEKIRIAKQKQLAEQKRKAEAKKKKDEALTSDIDAMLKETSDYKDKLERSESIKYY